MDFAVDIGFAILFRMLQDKKDVEKFRKAIRKLIRVYQLSYPEDEIWREVSARGNNQ